MRNVKLGRSALSHNNFTANRSEASSDHYGNPMMKKLTLFFIMVIRWILKIQFLKSSKIQQFQFLKLELLNFEHESNIKLRDVIENLKITSIFIYNVITFINLHRPILCTILTSFRRP